MNGRFIDNWFSNFKASPIYVGNKMWPDVETYFQAMKTKDEHEQEQIRTCGSPSNAKRLGRKVQLRVDWEHVKESIMEIALRVKFRPGTEWREKLDATTGPIIEWNNWGDRYWGMTLDGIGKNRLGEILMKIRDEVRN